MADVTWVKSLKDLASQRRWKPLIGHERKDKTGKNVDVQNLTRDPRLRSCFNKEKISTDGYASSDPVYFAWTNQTKSLAQGRWESHRCARYFSFYPKSFFNSIQMTGGEFQMIRCWSHMEIFDPPVTPVSHYSFVHREFSPGKLVRCFCHIKVQMVVKLPV